MKRTKREKDMHLPMWVCGLGVLLILVGLLWCFLRQFEASAYGTIERIAGTVLFLGFGASAVLCWNNQWIEMQDSNTFLYSTMFGRKKAYAFSDILEVKQNQDSFTLILETGKVHIESCAVLSDSFVQAVDSALERRSSQTATLACQDPHSRGGKVMKK